MLSKVLRSWIPLLFLFTFAFGLGMNIFVGNTVAITQQALWGRALDYAVVDNRFLRVHGRHKTTRVARWVLTGFIGVLVGGTAFAMEWCIDQLSRLRLQAFTSVFSSAGLAPALCAHVATAAAYVSGVFQSETKN